MVYRVVLSAVPLPEPNKVKGSAGTHNIQHRVRVFVPLAALVSSKAPPNLHSPSEISKTRSLINLAFC